MTTRADKYALALWMLWCGCCWYVLILAVTP
jgi:hypothetical protein